MKINSLQIENTKRVKAVTIEPAQNGITVIGGKNNQGKTSVLDAIVWALGGNKYKPSEPQREDSVLPPNIKLTLSNGLLVERSGKNSDLKVIDPEGRKSGQQLLDKFVEELALNLPKFMESSNKEKANTLLQIIGVGEQLYQLESKEKETYNQRHAIGQIADQKKKFADEQLFYTDAPDEFVSASELIKQQQDILARNGENQRKRDNAQALIDKQTDLKYRIEQLQIEKEIVDEDVKIAVKSVAELLDESTAELEKSIADSEEINRKVRINLDKEKAEEDAKNYKDQYDTLSVELDRIRNNKFELLKGADLPLPNLSIEDGELTYNNQKWDNMSGSEQLKVATAIVRKLNSDCGFVLLDKLEQMDLDTLREFDSWLQQEGLQAIATRVSTGDECQIIIEDGYAIENTSAPKEPIWKPGEF